jgi:hypothetical protein
VPDTQFVELKEDAPGDEQNAPKAMFAPHEVGDSGANQQEGPETPQSVDRKDAHVVKKQSDAAKNQECAPEEAARTPASKVNAHHDRFASPSGAGVRRVHTCVNITVNLVVQVIAEFLCIKIFLVAHKPLLSAPQWPSCLNSLIDGRP